ncbi:AMP-binding protein [Planomicrobium sp. YIM 101495]|uniref:AMP-binding protein n=1 Tax=Planomicrobium sp. YIM 101495 TaxID=2665160 RepID=UPI0012B7236B|nr:AMP-binding protein [Planomicrobium sp. YIM 101495]MTD31270.1 AMP-binding protein [Planomicrobium sp. YIM 101495]
MADLWLILKQMQLLSPGKSFRLLRGIAGGGMNLTLLFELAGKDAKRKTALVDDYGTYTYEELQESCENLAYHFREEIGLKRGQKVAFICRNHAAFVQSIFAVSRLGADVYLLNCAMSQPQFDRLIGKQSFDFIVHDHEFAELLEASPYNGACMCTEEIRSNLIGKVNKLKAASGGRLVLLTGGTTGEAKQIAHRPSLFNFLAPFAALLDRLELPRYRTAYIATPIYHGYGIAVLLAFFALGKKVVLQDRFHPERACALIRRHEVEVVTVVPLMVHKMLRTDTDALGTLTCIASGGAKLDPSLVKEVEEQLGPVLYNLYGTSEAGLNMIARPEDLAYDPTTIGRPIGRGKLKVMKNGREVETQAIGQFCFHNSWSMTNKEAPWIESGDLGYRDANGYYFLSGRKDDLIVSAGNNIYPAEVEAAVMCHAAVADAAVIGVEDEVRGQVLKAFVQLRSGAVLAEEGLGTWLYGQLAEFQVPREFVFVEELPYTAVGKLDRKQLK